MSLRLLALVSIAAATALAACGESEEREPAGKPEAGASAPKQGAGPPASAPPSVKPVPDADRAIDELVAAAKKRLASDKAVASNQRGYEKAIAKHERDHEGMRLTERLPFELDQAALEEALSAHAERHGLSLVELKLGKVAEPAAVPDVHRGDGPYRYTLDQLIGRVPVAVRVSPPDLAKLEPFFVKLPAAARPMLDLAGLEIAGDVAILTGHAYIRRRVTPPKHLPAEVTLESLAEAADVAVPAGHPRLAEVAELIAQHRELRPSLEGALEALATAHLMGSHFAFYEGRVREIERRRLPKPVRTDDKGGP